MCALLRFTINCITYAKHRERRRKLLGLLRNANSRIKTILRYALPMASKCNGVFVDFPICLALLSSTLRFVNAVHATRTLLARPDPPRRIDLAWGADKLPRNKTTKALVRFGGTRSPRCAVVILLNDGNTESYLKFSQNRPTDDRHRRL